MRKSDSSTTLFASAAFMALALATNTLVRPPLALAQATDTSPVLPGPYSSWTPDQVQQAAQLLKSGSNANCADWIRKAQDSQRYSYAAAICIGTYYVNHLPGDYPGLDAIKDSIRQNYANAKALESDIPTPATPEP